MKFISKLFVFVASIIVLLGVGAFLLPNLTKNKHSELAMAADNVNPLVKIEDVYASTNAKPIRHFIGGGGEDEYTYHLVTYNAQGQSRTLAFDSQWKLKPNKFLKISTKGQNVESWGKVDRATVPSGIRQELMMS
ncbi:YxeA family protein [Levilactobacillus wangkuiensis]|uniref:YxeA family protein n=1 Tax=Levilactobacillus wangkuiensis TaxID=2799566 RepID=UPI001940C7F1|nr:YxeA family protein [Levilactobacillus wangkuiensis]